MHESKKSKKEKSLMVAIPESSPSVEVNIYNDGEKREGKIYGGLSKIPTLIPKAAKAVKGYFNDVQLNDIPPKKLERVEYEIDELLDVEEGIMIPTDKQRESKINEIFYRGEKLPTSETAYKNKKLRTEFLASEYGLSKSVINAIDEGANIRRRKSIFASPTEGQRWNIAMSKDSKNMQRANLLGTAKGAGAMGAAALVGSGIKGIVDEANEIDTGLTVPEVTALLDELGNTMENVESLGGTTDEAFSKISRTPTKYLFTEDGKTFFNHDGAKKEYSLATNEEGIVMLMVPARTKKFEGNGNMKNTSSSKPQPAQNLLAGPDTPEFRAKQDEHYANVAKESQRVGEDEEVILSPETKNIVDDVKRGEAFIQRSKELKNEAQDDAARAYADKVRKQGQMILEGILNYTRDQNSLGGEIDDLQSQVTSAATSNSKKPNVITAAPDLKTVAALDYATTTAGQIELDKQALDPTRQMAKEGGKFPDLNKDGKVTQADILKGRGVLQEGGMAMPPELMQQPMPTEEPPVDTYPNIPPEEMAEVEASQLPDDEMEDDYLDFIVSESLSGQEQQYLMESLEADPQLSSIIDKLVLTASEFTGQGEVDGPGTGVSDSIPARLSDGEFVFTRKATDQLGADNLQTMMDDAERAYDGGLQKYALGGAVDDTVLGGAVKDTTPLMDEKVDMYGTNRQQDEMRKQMMYANRMPSIIGT